MASALSGDPAVTDERFTDWKVVLDPEYWRREFPGLETPRPAIVRWIEVDEREQPTGNVQENPDHRPGPAWMGYPWLSSAAAKVMAMRRVGWIDDVTMRRLLLDCEVLVPLQEDGQPIRMRGRNDEVVIPAYSSSTTVPSGYPRWRRIRPRDLLQPGSHEGWLEMDAGRISADTVDLSREINAPDLDRDPGRYTDEIAPEVSPAVTELAAELAEEFRLDPPGLVALRLKAVGGWARDNGFELSTEECRRYAGAYARYVRNLRLRSDNQPVDWPADLAGNGLITHYDNSGRPEPVPWTLGKFEPAGIRSGVFAWHRVLGAYVGFAIGECVALGSGDTLGPLTRQVLRHTETVLRGLPYTALDASVPASFPPAPRPGSWLSAALGAGPELPPNPLTAALAVTMTGGVRFEDSGFPVQRELAHKLTGAGDDTLTAVELLVRVFTKLLGEGEFVFPPHVHLQEMRASGPAPFADIAGIVLALRSGREVPDVEQMETLGTPGSALTVAARALFAATKRHHEPLAAIQSAAAQSADGPLAAALAGALTGARVGVPGLPADLVGALAPLGLLDNIASDVFRHFNRNGVVRDRSMQEYWAQRYPKE
ncbi:hypothetical protein [Amycolatopsis thermophila]|uniref:ADP-ribosylglycohydrolase n=1 Tax=Amycolatopsis thermophila TaxID=206084 RepID=A0ABU0ESH1_9PSEU|nr:hypothetical protein [Amycolatopsis thermophila]MDQ0378239.1 hypothetical protein [Amycolatopsis thermophila]